MIHPVSLPFNLQSFNSLFVVNFHFSAYLVRDHIIRDNLADTGLCFLLTLCHHGSWHWTSDATKHGRLPPAQDPLRFQTNRNENTKGFVCDSW